MEIMGGGRKNYILQCFCECISVQFLLSFHIFLITMLTLKLGMNVMYVTADTTFDPGPHGIVKQPSNLAFHQYLKGFKWSDSIG